MRAVALSTLLLLLVALTLFSIVASDGDPVWAILPTVLVGVAVAAWKAPLRWSLLVVTFLALTLENPSDTPACGQWKSPLYDVGALLLVHLNVTLPCKALAFSGLDLILVYLFVIAAVRRATGSRIDAPAGFAGAGPVGWFAGLSLVGAAWMWAYGIARGDADVGSSLWQLQRIAYLPALVFLFQLSFRGPEDTTALGKVIVWAACLKALLAIYIRATVAPPAGEPFLAYATTHADSMLFAVAFCLVLALLIHRRAGKKRFFPIALVLPLLVAGMVANGRRLVWVQLIAGLVTVVALTPRSAGKRSAMRFGVIMSPALLVYVLAGWNSSSALFKPVETLRSVVDSKADPSTLWRDLENYNLFYTLRHNAIFGTGYGHGYVEKIALPDVSSYYALYRFLPHNSVLGLWAYGGIVGFTALWTIVVVGLFLAARANRYATTVDDRAAALSALAIIVVYLTYCYGDLGLGTWVSVFTVAPAFAISSKLAVTTGAWPSAAGVPASKAMVGRAVEWELCQSRG
jgi:O-antigen ligase